MTTSKTNCCTGECCASFTMGLSVEKEMRENPEKYADGAFIVDMLKHIGKDPGDPSNPNMRPDAHNYTCRHWDPETKLCKAYDERPQMCREFPYSRICAICGMVGPQVTDLSKAQATWCCNRHRRELTQAEKTLADETPAS